MSGTTVVQKRNIEMLDIIRADVQMRYEAGFAWVNAASAMLMLPNLRAGWTFASSDENGHVYDISGQGRIITNHNVVPFYKLALCNYADFTPASSHYFSRVDEAGLDILNGFTILSWVWFDVLGVAYAIGGKWLSAGNQRSYLLYKGVGNNIEFYISSLGTAASTISVISASTITTSKPHFVAGRFNPSTELAVFLDNEKTISVAGIPAAIFNSTAEYDVGAYENGTVAFIDGRITLMALCATELTDAQIFSFYHWTRPLFGK